jgi:adenylate cyclase class 2
MKTEIEAKFVQQDHEAVRKKLKALGAEMVMPERTMRRVNFDFPDLRLNNSQNGWVRIRDEGDKITLSYKQSDDASVTGMQEVNLVIDDFDEAILFLKAVGITRIKAQQETKRESWVLNGVAIELDTWPWLQPFVEIEALSQEKLEETANSMGYSMTM